MKYAETLSHEDWVRACMVAHPGEYRWSSYRANAQGEINALIQPHEVYRALGMDDASRQAAYRELFRHELEPGLVDEIRRATNGNYALGSPLFAEQIGAALGRRVRPWSPGRPLKEIDMAGGGNEEKTWSVLVFLVLFFSQFMENWLCEPLILYTARQGYSWRKGR